MQDFMFDIQRFDTEKITLNAGETYTLDGISYKAIDKVTLTIDDTSAQVSGGKIAVGLSGTDETFTFDTSSGSLNYDDSTKKFTGTNGATVLLQDNFKAVASDKFNFTLQTAGNNLNLVLDDANYFFD